MKTNTKTFSIRLSEDKLNKLNQEARKLDITTCALIKIKLFSKEGNSQNE